jgi:ribosomal protein S8
MKVAILQSQEFNKSINILSTAPNMPITTKLKLKGFIRNIQQAAKDAEELRMEIVTKYAEKDEAGKPVIVGNNQVQLSDAAGFNMEFAAFMQSEAALPDFTLTVKELGEAANLLTVKDLDVLHEIIVD